MLLVVSSAPVPTLHEIVSNRHHLLNVRTAVETKRSTSEDVLFIKICKLLSGKNQISGSIINRLMFAPQNLSRSTQLPIHNRVPSDFPISSSIPQVAVQERRHGRVDNPNPVQSSYISPPRRATDITSLLPT